MQRIQTHLVKLLSVIVLTLTFSAVSSAQEVNTESFSGTVNTTITSGFTIRASERDCNVNFGYKHTSVVSAWGTVTSQNGAGCSGYRTDGFGNTSRFPSENCSNCIKTRFQISINLSPSSSFDPGGPPQILGPWS